MDSPPMFDFSRHDSWKAKMSCHLKTLGHLVFQATTKEAYPNDSKHKMANALALRHLEHLLIKIYYMYLLTMISFCSLEYLEFSQATKDYQQDKEI